ncbi:B-lymphocyte antigen CD20-like [Alligator sinensis]|uniref:B-lymphocyte antigen CD20-like n=1 Tax=Alligator sinensis TaxID=38654 RepID=A0A1U7RMJ7_ALLSI|nr:B-lymphocyte antigen CD20-like [Alligator sinensis]XP_006026097.1 B-lymphocyte antigen CD20-like [Alligator sinensis]
MDMTKANSVFRAGPPNNPNIMQMGHVVYMSSQTSKKKVSGQSEAYGSMQIIVAFVHIGLGGILLYSAKDFAPLIMTYGYPFWGGGLFFLSGLLASLSATSTIGSAVSSHIFNTFSILAALAGGILLGIDLFKISILNMRQLSIPLLEKIGLPSSYFLAVRCEDGLIPLDYCRALRSYETGMLALMLIFTIFQIIFSSNTFCSKSVKNKVAGDLSSEEVQEFSLMPTAYQ